MCDKAGNKSPVLSPMPATDQPYFYLLMLKIITYKSCNATADENGPAG